MSGQGGHGEMSLSFSSSCCEPELLLKIKILPKKALLKKNKQKHFFFFGKDYFYFIEKYFLIVNLSHPKDSIILKKKKKLAENGYRGLESSSSIYISTND